MPFKYLYKYLTLCNTHASHYKYYMFHVCNFLNKFLNYTCNSEKNVTSWNKKKIYHLTNSAINHRIIT